jgi:hypothetical protein
MSEFGRRFDPAELEDAEGGTTGDPAAAELLVVARDLEAFARSESVMPSVEFEERVMAAIALEPPPRAVSTGGLVGLVAAVRDAWRLVWSGGRPLAVRAQALAIVLLAAVAFGSVGSLALVGVGRLLSQNAAPVVTPSPAPTPSPTPSPSSPSPSPSVSPSPSSMPSASPSPTETAEPAETAKPTGDSSGPGSAATATPTDDSSGHGSGGDSSGSGSGTGSQSVDDNTPQPSGDSSGPG